MFEFDVVIPTLFSLLSSTPPKLLLSCCVHIAHIGGHPPSENLNQQPPHTNPTAQFQFDSHVMEIKIDS